MAAKPPKKPKRVNKLSHHKSTYKPKKFPVRLAHHKHTGRHLPFYCTSYAVLFFLLVFAGALLLFVTHSTKASQRVESGSVNLFGEVRGSAPSTAATIQSPPDGSRFTSPQLEVKGSCLEGSYIELYRNGSFAGMVLCSANNTFSITITLDAGKNSLKAKTRDSFGQYGPDSATVVVFYDPPGSSGDSIVSPVRIELEPGIYGALEGQPLAINYKISGDKPPYAVSVDWGDGEPGTLVSLNKLGGHKISHEFKKSGHMIIRFNALGSAGTSSTVQTVAVIYGAEDINISVGYTCKSTANKFSSHCIANDPLIDLTEKLWPALIVALLMTVSFWVGETVIYRRLMFRPGR